MSEHHFNLIDEPFIPVVTLEGKSILISLREALINSAQYLRVSASLPHTNAAIYRLLLTVLHRVFGPVRPEDWEEIWVDGKFAVNELNAYLVKVHPYFDLFDEQRPFFQRRHPQMEEKPAQALLQIVGGGDTYTLFDHRLDSTPFTLSPAVAAQMLLTAQSYGLAGLWHPQRKLFMTDAPLSRAITFFVEGKNLFETLMFNLVRYNKSTPFPWQEKRDLPAWEMENPYLPERTRPLGYLDYLTWHNRMIQLIPQEQNGQMVVTRVVIAPGLTLNAEVRNPMYHYSIETKPGGETSARPMRFNEGRALWRDSSTLLDIERDAVDAPRAMQWMKELVGMVILPRRRLQLAAYGMCTEPGKQKVNFYRGESFEFDDAILQDENLLVVLNTAIARAEDLRRELWSIVYQLVDNFLSLQADKEGGQKRAPEDVKKLVNHLDAEGLYWSRLETPFYRFLNRLSEDAEQALAEWYDELQKSMRNAYKQTADGLGNSVNGLKAAAITRGRVNHALKKVLGVQEPIKEG